TSSTRWRTPTPPPGCGRRAAAASGPASSKRLSSHRCEPAPRPLERSGRWAFGHEVLVAEGAGGDVALAGRACRHAEKGTRLHRPHAGRRRAWLGWRRKVRTERAARSDAGPAEAPPAALSKTGVSMSPRPGCGPRGDAGDGVAT